MSRIAGGLSTLRRRAGVTLHKLRLLRRRLRDRMLPAPRLDGWETALIGGQPLVVPTATCSSPHKSPKHAADPSPSAAPRCVIITQALDLASGLDAFVAAQARQFHAWGVPIAIAIVSDGLQQPPKTRLSEQLIDEGIEVICLNRPETSAWMATWRPEVASSHGAPRWFLEIAAATGLPVVETLHGPFGMFVGEEQTMAERAELITRFVAVSELVRERLLDVVPGFPADQVITIPNGVAPPALPDRAEARAALGLTDEVLLVSLSRYALQKNVYALARLFLRVAAERDNVHLVIAGRLDDHPYAARTLRLRRRSPHGARLHLRSETSDAALLLQAADGFVLDSYLEGWSLAATEATMTGTPLLLSEVPGARELIGVGDASYGSGPRGQLVPHPLGDAQLLDWRLMARQRYRPQANDAAFVAAALALVDQREEWESTRAAHAAQARELFSLERCLRAHLEVLTSVVGAHT